LAKEELQMDSEVLIEYLLSICISSCLKALRHLAPSHFGFQAKKLLRHENRRFVFHRCCIGGTVCFYEAKSRS